MQHRICSFVLLTFLAIPASHAQEAIFLIRHAEQMLDVEDPPITEAGQERARNWSEILKQAEISTVYTSKKTRTIQTGEPIAEALNVPTVSVPRKDITQLLDLISTGNADDRVLIVSHSKQIPKILSALGLPEDVVEKSKVAPTEYGSLFVYVPTEENGGSVFKLRYE